MTIRDAERFMAGVWDWGFLDGAFRNGRVKVSDIDGIVERNGNFLIFETKARGIDHNANNGQAILLERLASQRLNMVVWLFGTQADMERDGMVEAEVWRGNWKSARRLITLTQLRELATWWDGLAYGRESGLPPMFFQKVAA